MNLGIILEIYGTLVLVYNTSKYTISKNVLKFSWEWKLFTIKWKRAKILLNLVLKKILRLKNVSSYFQTTSEGLNFCQTLIVHTKKKYHKLVHLNMLFDMYLVICACKKSELFSQEIEFNG